ncbi:putative bifunctional methylthioribulose-1-phosphate dehydratase/enolase-phosphatase E1, partial [Ananas comosus]
ETSTTFDFTSAGFDFTSGKRIEQKLLDYNQEAEQFRGHPTRCSNGDWIFNSFLHYILVEDDLKRGVSGAVPIPPDDAGKEEVINSLVTNVEAMIKADRKIT